MYKKLLLICAFVAAIALAGLWATPRGSEATTWNPNFAPTDFYRLDPATPGANGDTHAQFNVLSPSTNFSALFGRAITFGDSDVRTASAADIPGTGAYVGSLQSVARLGLANEGCGVAGGTVTVVFNFVEANVSTTARAFTNPAAGMTLGAAMLDAPDDATTDIEYTTTGGIDPLGLKQGTDVAGLVTAPEGTALAGVNEIKIGSEEMLVVSLDAAVPATGGTYKVIRGWNGTVTDPHPAAAPIERVAVIYPNGPGTNLLANLGEDDGDVDNNGVDEEATGPAGGTQTADNQVADGADLVPSFVRNSLIPSGDPDDGVYVEAHARYSGVAFVASSLIVILQFVVIDVGDLTVFPNLDWANSNWGYASATFLQDPNAPPSDSAITDFCNFTSNTFLFGVAHDNLCTGASPPVLCTGNGAGFQLRLAVDGLCPGSTSPNECGLAAQTDGICNLVTCPRSTNPGAETDAGALVQCANAVDDDADATINDGCPLAGVAPPGGAVAEAGASCANATDDEDNDPVAVGVQLDGRVNDGCPTVGGNQRVRYYQYSVSQRDYDNDNHENALDACSYNPNPDGPGNTGWNPRDFNSQPGADGLPATGDEPDIDGDGLPNPCDPGPAAFDADEDADGGGTGWFNRLDNCPTVANVAPVMAVENALQFDMDVPIGDFVPDGGPNSDSIGPECDIAANGNPGICPSCTGTLSSTGANGHYHAAYASHTICVGTVTTDCAGQAVCDGTSQATMQATCDADEDGVVNASDTCLGGANPPDTFAGPSGQATLTMAEGIGSTVLDIGDSDGFITQQPIVVSSPQETLRYITAVAATTITINIGLNFAHGIGDNVAQVSFAQSMRDVDNSGFSDVITDISKLTAAFGSQGGDPANDGVGDAAPAGYQGRYDVNNDRFVDIIGDISKFTSVFGATCGPAP